jgi:peptidoglycan/xylan/chitin deacetylase (PgdA/CDA1 family)
MRVTRRLFTDVLNALPYPLYRRVTDILKRLRGQAGTPPFQPGPYLRLTVDSRWALSGVRVCLTHDIDTQDGADFWPKVAQIEESLGLRSTFNVLTAGPYRLDLGWLDELQWRGFEIGLHGDTHDMAIGYRNMKRVEDRLRRCLDTLQRPIAGYRAPAFAGSEPLLRVLEKLGFRYDSSIRARVCYAGDVDVCIPYLYPGTRMWEFPVVNQDDWLFRDRALDDKEALFAMQAVVRALQSYGGLLVFNSHPIHLEAHISFYRQLLTWLVEAQIQVILMGDLVMVMDDHVRDSGRAL